MIGLSVPAGILLAVGIRGDWPLARRSLGALMRRWACGPGRWIPPFSGPLVGSPSSCCVARRLPTRCDPAGGCPLRGRSGCLGSDVRCFSVRGWYVVGKVRFGVKRCCLDFFRWGSFAPSLRYGIIYQHTDDFRYAPALPVGLHPQPVFLLCVNQHGLPFGHWYIAFLIAHASTSIGGLYRTFLHLSRFFCRSAFAFRRAYYIAPFCTCQHLFVTFPKVFLCGPATGADRAQGRAEAGHLAASR